jgi:DNA modification methylase
MNMELYNGNCLEVMKDIESGSVDAIICDPPYGITACKWDSVIDFDLMWEQLNRIIKPNGAIVLFGSEPFSSALRMSNIKNYKYDWIWDKVSVSNPQLSKHQPLKGFELIHIFSSKGKALYYPQGLIEIEKTYTRKNKSNKTEGLKHNSRNEYTSTFTNYPRMLSLKFPRPYNNTTVHPTQKPVALMEYLIRTYTNENETVLDFTMGSGSTGVAAKNTNRKFIGIEQDESYFKIAQERIGA